MTTANIATVIALQTATIVGLCAWLLHLKREAKLRFDEFHSFVDHDGEGER